MDGSSWSGGTYTTTIKEQSRTHNNNIQDEHGLQKMTELIWHQLYNTWEIRNDTLHGIDQSSREVARLERATRETEALYTVKDCVLPRDKDLFYSSLAEHHIQEPTSRGLQ